MAEEYIYADYIPCFCPHKVFKENPVVSAVHDWTQFGGIVAFPVSSTERIEPERVRGHREVDTKDLSVTKAGVQQVLDNIPAFDVVKADLVYWLMAFFQKVVDGGSVGAYTHAFQPYSPNPDFAADAGYLLHYMFYHPISGRSWIACNCIVNQLTIRISTDTTGARLTIEPQLIPRQIQELVQPSSTTIAANAESYWLWRDLQNDESQVSLGVDSPDFYSLELVLTNGAAWRGQDGDGLPNSFLLGKFRAIGTLRVLKRASDTDDWVADWLASNKAQLKVYWNPAIATPAAGDLLIDVFDVLLERPTPEAGPATEQLYAFPIEGTKPSAGLSHKITVVDAIETVDSLFAEP